jgi:hypothetical protein
MGVVGYALFWLRAVLVPLVLAIALSYLLQPAIEVLTKRPIKCCWGICVLCRERPQLHSVRPCIRPFVEALIEFRLPYYVSVCIVLALSMAMLCLIGFIVADSVHVFTRHADVYGTRVQTLIIEAIDFYNRMQDRLFGPSTPGNLTEVAVTNDTAAVAVSAEEEEPTLEQRLLDISRRIDRTQVTSIVMSGLSSLLETVSNLFLVMLFTLYLLLGVSPYFACPLELRGCDPPHLWRLECYATPRLTQGVRNIDSRAVAGHPLARRSPSRTNPMWSPNPTLKSTATYAARCWCACWWVCSRPSRSGRVPSSCGSCLGCSRFGSTSCQMSAPLSLSRSRCRS